MSSSSTDHVSDSEPEGSGETVSPPREAQKSRGDALASHPEYWSESDVNAWAQATIEDENIVQVVAKNRLNGHYLLRLTGDEIREMIPLIGPRKAFNEAIAGLRNGPPDHRAVGSSQTTTTSLSTEPRGPCSGSSIGEHPPVGKDIRLVNRCRDAMRDPRRLMHDKTLRSQLLSEIDTACGGQLASGYMEGLGSDEGAYHILSAVMVATEFKPGKSLSVVYSTWEKSVVSRADVSAYLEAFPAMRPCFEIDPRPLDLAVFTFHTDDAMATSLGAYARDIGLSSAHQSLLEMYSRAAWRYEGSDNVGSYPPSLYIVKVLITSRDERWFSFRRDCSLSPVFEAGRRCGVVPETERIAVLAYPARAESLVGGTSCVVRDDSNRLLIYVCGTDGDNSAAATESNLRSLVDTYEFATADWPLTPNEKVELLKITCDFPDLVVVPGRTISVTGSDMSQAAWCRLLELLRQIPELEVKARPQVTTLARIHTSAPTENRAMATAFTPDPDGSFSGWATCPWDPTRLYMRRMDPRVSCRHNTKTAEVTCSDNEGYLALLLDGQRILSLGLCERGSNLEALPDADRDLKVVIVRCTFSGSPTTYTIVDPIAGNPLSDPSYVRMPASTFAVQVVQLKPIGRLTTQTTSSVASNARRAESVSRAVMSDEIDNEDRGDSSVSSGAGADTRPLKVRRKDDASSPSGLTIHDQQPAPDPTSSARAGAHMNAIGFDTTEPRVERRQTDQIKETEQIEESGEGGEIVDASVNAGNEDDECDICGATHDTDDDRMLICEATGPHEEECNRCTHLKCMGLARMPTWSFCRDHSNELYDARVYYRAMCKLATSGDDPSHSVTSWTRAMSSKLRIGETTVRDFIRYDPGTKFTPHQEQGSLTTNLSFLRLWRDSKRAEGSAGSPSF